MLAEPTFKVDGRVGVRFSRRRFDLLDVLFVVVTLEIVALVVDKRWVAMDNGSLIASMLGNLRPRSQISRLSIGTGGRTTTNLLVSSRATGGFKVALVHEPAPPF